MLLDLTTISVVEWSRWQFALTAIYHYMFVPLTLGLALISFGAWLILIFKFAGPKAVLHEWFGNKASRSDVPAAVYYFLSLIFLGVGVIEVISILFRPISLSFRLFGNVFGGETLMHSTGYFTAFYFLELLVGVVQALVFTLLSAVYIGLITNHDDEPAEDAGTPASCARSAPASAVLKPAPFSPSSFRWSSQKRQASFIIGYARFLRNSLSCVNRKCSHMCRANQALTGTFHIVQPPQPHGFCEMRVVQPRRLFPNCFCVMARDAGAVPAMKSSSGRWHSERFVVSAAQYASCKLMLLW